MTLLGKTETTQQSGDNSTNINAGGDVAISYQGLSYRDVRDIFDDMLRDRFNQFSRIAKKEAQKVVHAFLEKWLPELPQDKFYRFQEPKIQLFLHDVFSAYFESDDNNNLEKILFHALKTNLNDADAQKNAVIRRAVQVLPMLSQQHINYLSFIYYSLYTTPRKDDVYNLVKHTHEMVSLLYSDIFIRNNFLSLLYEARCLQPTVGRSENINFNILALHNYSKLYLSINTAKDIYQIFNDSFIYVKDLFEEDCQTPRKVLTTWTYTELENELRKRGMEQYTLKLFLFLHHAYPEEVKTALSEIGSKLQRFAYVWNDKKFIHSSLELTTVGRAIAIFNCKAKMKGFEEVEFTI